MGPGLFVESVRRSDGNRAVLTMTDYTALDPTARRRRIERHEIDMSADGRTVVAGGAGDFPDPDVWILLRRLPSIVGVGVARLAVARAFRPHAR